MPVTRSRGGALWLAVAVLGLLGCGDDDSPGGVGTGGKKDSGPKSDAALDAALDAEVEQPPFVEGPRKDAGRDSGMTRPPVTTMPDATVAPTCETLGCEAMSDECNVVSCDPKKVACVVTARPDGTACGSDALDNCSAPDECRAGVCEPRHAAVGTPCGLQNVDCQLNDHCDGDGHCVDEGVAPEGTACGEQTPSDDDCDEPDSCDASGACQPRYEPADTPCGDEDVLCRHDDKCDGFGACQDGGFWSAGACPAGEATINVGGNLVETCLCGRTDQDFCHPEKDICQEGTCVPGNRPDGTACGSANDTECDNPDKCMAGMCSTNPAPPGTSCGSATVAPCNGRDLCDGGGNCDPNFVGPEVACGPAPGECAEAPHCSGTGSCGTAQRKPAGTLCGGTPAACRKQQECSGGSDLCPAATFADVGIACGNPVASDPNCDAPDSCNAAGNCASNNQPLETPCGSNALTECSLPDSCNANGTCNPHHVGAGAACGDQGLSCFHDDSCNGAGACTDNGFDSPCPLSGTVFANNAGVQGVTVSVIGGNSAVTDVNGEFSLSVPLGQQVLLRVSDKPGYYGEVRARTFSAVDAGRALEITLQADGSLDDAADGVSPPLTVELDKGIVLVLVQGSTLTGDEGATISTTSAPSIAEAGGDYQYSESIVAAMPGGLLFYNAEPSANNVITPIDGVTTTCMHQGSISTFPVFAHTITWSVIECQ